MKSHRRSMVAAVFAGVVWSASSVSGGAQAADPIEWRIQTALVSGSMYFDVIESFAQRVERMSGGRLQAKVLPDGAVVQSFELLDAVDKGIVEAGFAWTHFWSGKHPAAYLFSDQPSIKGLDQLGFVSWYLEGDGYDLYNELYEKHLDVNVQPFIVLLSGGQPLGWFKKPISGLAEFQTFKYRSPPGLTGELFKEMGVSAVALPAGEIVPSAQRGTIDAAEWINPGEDIKVGLHQVWKHYYLQGFHQASDLGEIIINKDFWDKLSPDLQAIIETAAMATITESIAVNINRNADALITLREEHGVTIHDTPTDLYPAFLEAADNVLARNAEKDEFFAKVSTSLEEHADKVMPYWTKLLGLYQSLGEAALKQKKQ